MNNERDNQDDLRQPILRNAWRLALFVLVTTALVATIYQSTRERIIEQQEALQLSLLNQIIDVNAYDNALHLDCVLVTNDALIKGKPARVYRARQDGSDQALVAEVITPEGYSGDIKLLVGMTADGTITAARVVQHKETPGLGDKIDKSVSDWIDEFSGKRISPDSLSAWAIRKEGGIFDQFTGATITPRAVVNAIAEAGLFLFAEQQRLFEQDAPSCAESDQR